MKITLSLNELLTIEEYAKIMLEYPCDIKCSESDRSACCGCPEAEKFIEMHHDTMTNYGKLIQDNPMAKSIINSLYMAYKNANKCQSEYNKARKMWLEADEHLSTLIKQVKPMDTSKIPG